MFKSHFGVKAATITMAAQASNFGLPQPNPQTLFTSTIEVLSLRGILRTQ